uniref:Uncharacterized protein n=1 Tax=Arundo donax TaxID=35708 RepID=A0A0A9FRZ7_ARUDO
MRHGKKSLTLGRRCRPARPTPLLRCRTAEPPWPCRFSPSASSLGLLTWLQDRPPEATTSTSLWWKPGAMAALLWIYWDGGLGSVEREMDWGKR